MFLRQLFAMGIAVETGKKTTIGTQMFQTCCRSCAPSRPAFRLLVQAYDLFLSIDSFALLST